MIRVITTFLILLSGSSLMAQTDSMTVSLSSGWNHSKILDEFLSPMQYKGGGYLIQAGLEQYNERYYDRFGLIYQKNNIEPELDNNSSANLYRGSIDWIRAWKLNAAGGLFSLFLGGHFLTSYTGISHEIWPNNSYSHSLAFNFGPSLVMSVTPFPSPQDLLIAWELSVPVLNYIIRPSSGSILPDGAINRGAENTWTIITGGRLTSLNDYQRIYSRIYLSTRMTERMNVRAGYQWDFQNYSVNNQYQSVNYFIYIGASYRFKK